MLAKEPTLTLDVTPAAVSRFADLVVRVQLRHAGAAACDVPQPFDACLRLDVRDARSKQILARGTSRDAMGRRLGDRVALPVTPQPLGPNTTREAEVVVQHFVGALPEGSLTLTATFADGEREWAQSRPAPLRVRAEAPLRVTWARGDAGASLLALVTTQHGHVLRVFSGTRPTIPVAARPVAVPARARTILLPAPTATDPGAAFIVAAEAGTVRAYATGQDASRQGQTRAAPLPDGTALLPTAFVDGGEPFALAVRRDRTIVPVALGGTAAATAGFVASARPTDPMAVERGAGGRRLVVAGGDGLRATTEGAASYSDLYAPTLQPHSVALRGGVVEAAYWDRARRMVDLIRAGPDLTTHRIDFGSIPGELTELAYAFDPEGEPVVVVACDDSRVFAALPDEPIAELDPTSSHNCWPAVVAGVQSYAAWSPTADHRFTRIGGPSVL